MQVSPSVVSQVALNATSLESAETKQNPVFTEPILHKVDEDALENIVSAILGIVGNDSYATAFPIAFPREHRGALAKLVPKLWWAFDHLHVFLNLVAPGVSERNVNVFFVDLTPGQVAAKLQCGSLWSGTWGHPSPDLISNWTVLDDKDRAELSSQDVIDKLVVPTVPDSTELRQIGVLHPDGPSPELSLVLESRFPGTPIKWLSLSDLSQNVAAKMHFEETMVTEIACSWGSAMMIDIPVGTSLANEHVVTVAHCGSFIPTTRRATFTTAHDNQTTVTLQIIKGGSIAGKVALEGLTPRLKGLARIQVTFDIDHSEDTVVMVEDLGSEAMAVAKFPLVAYSTKEEIDAYIADQLSQQVELLPNEDGIVGDLPE